MLPSRMAERERRPDTAHTAWDANADSRIPMTVSVIIAAYNERNFIEEILRRVQVVGVAHEIVVVDDGSTDGTREWLTEMHRLQQAGETEAEILGGRSRLPLSNIHFLFQEHNQ